MSIRLSKFAWSFIIMLKTSEYIPILIYSEMTVDKKCVKRGCD